MKLILIAYSLLSINSIWAFGGLENIEHQIRICDDEQSIIRKLNTEIEKSKIFQVLYFETPNHDYERLNWSLRARLKSNKVEITIKKRSSESERLNTRYPNIVCEYDAHGPVSEYSCKLNSEVDIQEFSKVLKNKKNWTEILDSTQLQFLKDFNAVYENAVIFGTLDVQRFQWNDKVLGLMTLDFVHQNSKEENTFNEISIRYPKNSGKEIGLKFEKYIKTIGIITCPNQVDWPINKFDILKILN